MTVTRTPDDPSRRSCSTALSQSTAHTPASAAGTGCGGRSAAAPSDPDLAASTAQYTASGVDGQPRSTDQPRGPNAATACRSASRTLKASISGGSPTAFEPYTTPDSVARSNRCTLNSSGISEKLGILYVLAAWVFNRPRLAPSLVSQRSSSRVSQPAPCTKPPSIWPRSISGDRLSPTSCTMSTRRSRYAPVKPSTSTSEQAAP